MNNFWFVILTMEILGTSPKNNSWVLHMFLLINNSWIIIDKHAWIMLSCVIDLWMMKVITVVHTDMKIENLKCKRFLISSTSSNVLCSMAEAVLGHLKTLGSRSLLSSHRLLRRGLPRLGPVFLRTGPLLPMISSWGQGLLCWTFLPWLFYCSIKPFFPCV